MKLIVKIAALLLGGEPVVLQDWQGETYYTIAYVNAEFGTKWARVYPFTAVGFVVLNDDGTTSSRSSSYIERWSKMD